ncbi:hypothetical protein PQI07_22495 [Methylobacterium sp. 092160098-2]|nr:hypothetical protein [Methylobacterium sp. 092160098-2]MDE4913453.1 hypothetical protein [Methylobacterium sp. 092160098-2]
MWGNLLQPLGGLQQSVVDLGASRHFLGFFVVGFLPFPTPKSMTPV